MKTLDFTSGIELNEHRDIELIAEYHNGARYSYSGQTKKECLNQFKTKWGNFRGFVKKEFRVYGSESIDYVES